jgi:phosphatidyl-myo-inositol dimannoside synthase
VNTVSSKNGTDVHLSPRDRGHACLFLCKRTPPPWTGGSAVYDHYLLSKCKDRDLIMVSSRNEGSDAYDRSLPFPVVRMRLWGTGTRLAILLWLAGSGPILAWLLLKHRAAVLHIGACKWDLLGGWLAAKMTRRKLVVTIHGEDLAHKDLRPWWNIKRIWRLLLVKMTAVALRRCDTVLCNSNFTAGLVLQRGVHKERVVVITPGIESGKTYPPAIPDPALVQQIEGKRVILTVGRFMPRKGQEIVLRALPEIRREFPDVIYVMAGGARREAAGYVNLCSKLAADKTLNGAAIMLEDPADDLIAWLYSVSEAFVMPNRTMPDGDTEGYGIVFLEAGWWRLPVVGGRAGGAVEAVDDGITGILVDGENHHDVARAIRMLLNDRALAKRMGDAGRAKVARNDWMSKAEQYRDLILELAEPRQRNG